MSEQQLEELKEYVVHEVRHRNDTNKHYTLHRKGECSCTKESFYSPLYSYDTYEEAKNAYPDLQYCRHCKTILEIIKEESKEYIVCEKMVTVEKHCFELHRKGECSCTKESFGDYCSSYSYDTYEEAKKAHRELKYCKDCQTVSKKRKEETPTTALLVLAFVLSGLTGFFWAIETLVGRILVGVIFAVLGLLFAKFYSWVCLTFAKKKLKTYVGKTIFKAVIEILLCALLLFCTFKSFGFGETIVKQTPYEKAWNDLWDKDPNEWTDREKEYVNDFFNWLN